MRLKNLVVGCLLLCCLGIAGCGVGVLSFTVTYKNPSYDYTCVPLIDGEEQTQLETTSNRSFFVGPGEHEFNAIFFSDGNEIDDGKGQPKTVNIDQDWEVACWQFYD